MRIAYHLGVHCTDEERLVKTLLRNRAALAAEGISIPGPARYRALIRETAASLQGRPATAETQAMIMEQILDGEAVPQRMVLAWDNFLAFPPWVLRGSLYPMAGARMKAIRHILPHHETEFHMAIRNPASFLPALLSRLKDKTYEEFIGTLHPQDLFWSEMIGDIAENNPSVPVHVWCDEDSPLLWPEILMAVAGHDPATVLEGTDELLAGLMSAGGMEKLRHRLAADPPATGAERRRIAAAFIDEFGQPERMEMEVDLPGWTAELIEAMSLQYDQDMARIAAIPGVTLTLP